MIINKHDCFNILFDLQSKGNDVHDDIKKLMSDDVYIPTSVIKHLKESNYPIITFYLNLNNKAHKIIKEILSCDNKPISVYIKIATSIITQATIAIEHNCIDDITSQNIIIEYLQLKELSQALCTYFTTGDFSELVSVITDLKQDVKTILDSISK